MCSSLLIKVVRYHIPYADNGYVGETTVRIRISNRDLQLNSFLIQNHEI